MEKKNLEQRKFDREIPGSAYAYFYYRNEDYTAIDDSQEWAVEMGEHARKTQKMMLFSELDQILLHEPHNIHNPLHLFDPYQHIRIRA